MFVYVKKCFEMRHLILVQKRINWCMFIYQQLIEDDFKITPIISTSQVKYQRVGLIIFGDETTKLIGLSLMQKFVVCSLDHMKILVLLVFSKVN